MPRGRKPKRRITIKSKETKAVLGLLLIGSGIAVFMADTLQGKVLEYIFYYFGEGVFLLGFWLVLVGLRLLGFKHKITSDSFLTGVFLLFLWYIALLGFVFKVFNANVIAGILGEALHAYLWSFLGTLLEALALVLFFLIAISFIVGPEVFEWISTAVNKTADLSLRALRNSFTYVKALAYKVWGRLRGVSLKKNIQLEEPSSTPIVQEQLEPAVAAEASAAAQELPGSLQEQTNPQPVLSASQNTPESSQPAVDIQIKEITNQPEAQVAVPSWLERAYKLYKPKFLNWQYPPIHEIFLPPVKDHISQREIEQTSRKIEEVLESFKIHARVTKVFVGPSVIQYALNIASGVKVAKVRSLARDIALAIAAPSDSIRVETIAGTSLIGIEVPRKNPRIVRAIEIIGSEEFKNTNYELPLAIGKDIHGKPVILNLYDMPHLLIAGATGSGKSVAINMILSGLLSKFTPDEVKFILVDPKMVEMEPYNDIPHLLTPVITDMSKTSQALDWLIFEMQERYNMFKQAKARNIKEFNAQSEVKLPYIILVIDEMADLILSRKAEVETKIVRLAQLARATGIHLILATQRPSVNVITGLIKANIPARIALAVASNVDSRVIIDQNGAETLLGKGDMLIKTPNSTKLMRVQGAFVSTKEVGGLTGFLRRQAQEAGYTPDDIYIPELYNLLQGKGISPAGLSTAAGADPLLREAIQLVVAQQKVSASLLQRYLKIGFNRAARLIDALEKLGVISPLIGNKRKVLIKDPSEVPV